VSECPTSFFPKSGDDFLARAFTVGLRVCVRFRVPPPYESLQTSLSPRLSSRRVST